MQRQGTWLRSLLITLGLMALLMALTLCASAADTDWDGQTNQDAGTLMSFAACTGSCHS